MFKEKILHEAETLLEEARTTPPNFYHADMLDGLPAPVQKYLRSALTQGQPMYRTARLKQHGQFRPTVKSGWQRLQAEQYFSTQPPAFIWHGRVEPIPFFWVSARDYYWHGQGNMLIKVMSAWTLDDARGAEMTQASLLRWLAEAVWFPCVFADSGVIQWEIRDAHSAVAHVSDGETSVFGIYYFNGDHLPVRFAAERPYGTGKNSALEKWGGVYHRYQECGGMMIPFEAEVTWYFAAGDHPYARLTLSDVQYDHFEPY